MFQKRPWVIFLALCGITVSVGEDRAIAQIVPDNTLGSENSIVTPVNPVRDRIDGGAIRNNNLFHSFTEFNIGEGREAYFSNSAAIENIFSRVTGSNPSQIFGKLGVLGDANLFLLNQISVDSQGEGIGGDIEFTAGKLNLNNGKISAETRSNTGGDNITAKEIEIIGKEAKSDSTSAILAQVERGATGDAGNLTIKTNRLLLKDAGQV